MNTSDSYQPSRSPLIVTSLVVVVAVVVTWRRMPELVRFDSSGLLGLAESLAPFVLVALLIERAIEVVITGVRSGRRRAFEGQGDNAGLHLYKIQTQRIAFLMSSALGLLIAAAGVRILSSLVADGAVYAVESNQHKFFLSLDVVMTGLVLGGGAEGFHRIVGVFNAYMDQARNGASSQGSGTAILPGGETASVSGGGTE